MKYYIFLFSVLFITACSSSRKSTHNRYQLKELTVNASDSKYRESKERTWDITHTDVTIEFNFQEKTAKGVAVIDLHPYFYSSDKIILDAKSMEIENVSSYGKQLKSNYNNDSLTIYLDREYHRSETLQVAVNYIAKPYDTKSGGSKAIRDDRGLYFINTDNKIPGKPVQIWTQGETEATSHWVPTFDQPNERFTFALHIIVPDSLTTLSNGVLTRSFQGMNGMRVDNWEMNKEVQPYVMMMAIGKFEVISDESWNGKTVNYYVEPEYSNSAREMFKNTPEMIGFFSNVTGVPYPWSKYSQVVVRDYVSGAMENTSASLFGEFMNQTKKELADKEFKDIVAHELFHQWFGDYVTAESWSNLTLNESFANYGEQLWRRYKYGQASEEKLAFEDYMSYLNQTETNDEALVRFHYRDKEDMFDRISYQKGGAILRYLHGLVGDSAFYKAMKIYLTDNALQPAEAHNWRMAVEKATGKDWNWFFNQWYFKGGHPVLDVQYQFDDKSRKVAITFKQQQDELYRLPLKISVVTGENIFTDIIDMDVRTMTVTYPYHDSTRPAVIPDAAHWLVGELVDNKTEEHWLRQYLAAGGQDYATKLKAIRANMKDISNQSIQNLYKKAIFDSLEHIREYAIRVLYKNKNPKVRNTFEEDILYLAKEDPSRHVRAYANAVIGEWNIEKGEQHLYEALKDESYKVASEALKAIGVMNKDTLYTLSKSLLSDESQGELTDFVWYYIAEGGMPEDTTWLKNTYNKVRATGKHKLEFCAALAIYMQNTPSDAAFKVALDGIENIIQSEGIAIYRGTVASYIFETAYFYKQESKDANKLQHSHTAERRLATIKESILRIEAQETDEENLADYKMYREAIYGK